MKLRIISIFLAIIFLFSLFSLPLHAQTEQLDPIVRVRLAKARLMLINNQNVDALRLLASLRNKYPDQPEILFMDSIANRQVGRWRRSFILITKAKKLAPDDKYINEFYRTLYKERQSFIAAGHSFEFRKPKAEQQITTLQAEKIIYPFTNAGIQFQYNKTSADLLQRSNGVQEKTSASSSRGEIYLNHDYKKGDDSHLALYLANDIGAGFAHNFWYPKGFNKVIIEYQRPNWNFLEGVVDEAVRDKIEVGRSQQFANRLFGDIAFGLHRYSLNDESNVLSTSFLKMNLFYNLKNKNSLVQSLGKDSYITIGYNFDGEYKSSIKSKTRSNNTVFNPLQFSSREIHTGVITVGRQINRFLLLEGYAGISKNRFSGVAPAIGGKMIYEFLPQIELTITASHSVSTDSISDTSDRIEAIIKKRF